MWNPRATSEGSIMPRYPWIIENVLDVNHTADKMRALATLGVPYSEEDFDSMKVSMQRQAIAIEKSIFADAADLKDLWTKREKEEGDKFVPLRDREIVALIAYLQRLGTDIKAQETQTASN